MEPCGTPACIFRGVDSSPSTITLNFLGERNELISLIKLDKKCYLDSLYTKPGCNVVSNAFLISKKTTAVYMLLRYKVMWSMSHMHSWCAQKPNWHRFSMLFSSMCLWIVLRMTFSKSLPVVGRRLSGLKF